MPASTFTGGCSQIWGFCELLIERTGITKQVSMHVYFDTDQMCYKFSWRVGGRPDWSSAITGNNSTITRSPYVTLAARA